MIIVILLTITQKMMTIIIIHNHITNKNNNNNNNSNHNPNHHHHHNNNNKSCAGLGGLVLEGLPGIGKSDLLTHTLLALGYQEGRDFYRVPASMQYEDKRALLLKAFHEGTIVVIDEINSSPMMERLLNGLLTGKGPNGEPAVNPGFMLLATQNPASMDGRNQASRALARRVTTITLPEYNQQEVQQILEEKGVPANRANSLARSYQQQIMQASLNKSSHAFF